MGGHLATRIQCGRTHLCKYSSLLVVLILFCLVRSFQYPSRPFNTAPIHNMHALDVEILEHDLFQGLYYLHSQPPLFNLMLGVGLKVLPDSWFAEGFACLYFILGLGLFGLCERLMNLLGVPWLLRILLLVGFLFHEPILSAERYLIYTHPLAFLIVLGIYASGKWIQNGKPFWLAAALISLASIVLMRSFFHLILWMLPMLALLYLASFRFRGRCGKKEVLAGIITVAFCSLFYAKNLVVAGEFTSSTWFGMNFAAMTAYMDPKRTETLLAVGKITPLVNIRRFSPPQVYIDYYGAAPHTGIEALDAPTKSTGKPNFNNFILVRASQESAANTITQVKDAPLNYLKAVLNEVHIYFSQTPGRVFNEGSPWRPALDLWRNPLSWTCIRIWIVPILAFLMYVWIVVLQLRELKKFRVPPPSDSRTGAATLVHLLCAFNLVYVLLIAGLFELGEGCFMRIPIDPLILIGGAVLMSRFFSVFLRFFSMNYSGRCCTVLW